eukprot:108960_1
MNKLPPSPAETLTYLPSPTLPTPTLPSPAETLTYLPSPTLPTHHTSNIMLKSLLNSILLEPLMMEVIIGKQSCRNVDIFSIAELYRSTVHRIHLNIAAIDMYKVINNSHIGNNTDNNKKMFSLLIEEFINYGELFVVEWLCQIEMAVNKVHNQLS